MSARTPDEVSRTIREKLKVTTPGLSMEVGTIERKIVDACAEAISEASVGQYVSGSLLDINARSGAELEQFVGIFGFGRLQGRRAMGVVRMELAAPATQPIQIQSGAQFSVPGGGPGGTPLAFISRQPAMIQVGSFSADVPVQCTLTGTIGNVPPGSVTSLSNSVGATSVTNLTAMKGGVDVETDEELRARFKATFLRNVAGTEDFYRALCLQNKNVSQVVVYGPTNTYRTQIEVTSGSNTIEVNNDVKYVWPRSEMVYTALGQEDETFYSKDTDYTFLQQVPPVLTPVSGGELTEGTFVDVEFEYTTRSSRNDPANGLTNKVDIFVNGTDPVLVTEKTLVRNTTFSSSSSSPYYTGNFVRVGTSTPPEATNRFMRLGSTPLVSFPPKFTIDGTIYTQGVHYHVVRGTTELAGSEREEAGLEWTSAGPSTGTRLTVSYTYNRTPELLNAQIKGTKQITTDVLVRQSNYTFLKVYLTVEYHRGRSIALVNNNIQTALRGFFAGFNYGEWIEFSDVTSLIHGVDGVDNVWVTTATEAPTGYGIEEYHDRNGSNLSHRQDADFKLEDNELPVFLEAVIKRKANR